MNTLGQPVPGVRIEMWHTDNAGRYDLIGYRFRTKLSVDSGTEYAVETIMPGHYDDRPAQHIHYLITAPGHRTLITQAYFATDPWFEGDPDKNFRKRGIVGNRDLIRPVKLYEQGTVHAAIDFDICMEKA
jgi:protocatechuate 3,4-dioxygenase beta subunit